MRYAAGKKPNIVLALIVSLLTLQVTSPIIPAFAQGFAERREARQAQAEFNANAAAFRQAAGRHMDLDLASTQASVAVTQAMLGSASQAEINVGNLTRQVAVGDMLTASEFVALAQVMTGKSQSLLLSDLGHAVGGNFSLADLNTSKFSSLSVPQGVTAVLEGRSSLHVSDTLSAQGTLLGMGNNAMNSVNIRAGNVLVDGALATAQGAVNMSVFAMEDLTNNGSMSASGMLSVLAGGTLTNTGSMTGGQGVSLYSNAGQFTNSGQVVAQSGNVYLGAGSTSDLTFNNVGGSVTANQGSIYVRDLAFAAKNLTALSGGNFSANSLNVSGGDGHVLVDVNQLSGVLNVSGGTAQVVNRVGDLNVGEIALTGDPTFANSGGNVVLTSNLIFKGQDLAILASGNVVAASNVKLIDVSDVNPGDVYIVAGFNFTPSTGGTTEGPPGNNATTYTYPNGGAASTDGGGIQLGLVSINASSTALSGNGTAGHVTLVAKAGTAPDPLNTATIEIANVTTTNKKADNGGNILMIGQNGVQVNGTLETSGLRQSGNVTLLGATPVISGGSITFLNGTKGGTGSFTAPAVSDLNDAAILVKGKVLTVGVARNGGNILMNADEDITVNGLINASGGNYTLNTFQTAGNGGTVQIFGGFNDVFLNAGVMSNGGVFATSGDSDSAGNGGQIFLTALGLVSVTGNVMSKGGDNKSTADFPFSDGGNGGLVSINSTSIAINKGGIDMRGGKPGYKGDAGNGGDVVTTSQTIFVDQAITTIGANTTHHFDGGDGGDVAIGIVGNSAGPIQISVADIITQGGHNPVHDDEQSGAFAGNGGHVTLLTTNPVTTLLVDGDIITSGGNGGDLPGNAGNIRFSPNVLNPVSFNTVTINGNLIAGGGNSGSDTTGGTGGAIIAENVVNNFTVNGFVSSKGGNSKTFDGFPGEGGNAGEIRLLLLMNTFGTTPRAFRLGQIVIKSYVDARGGDGVGVDADGGNGANISLGAATVQVLGKNGDFSVSAASGKFGLPSGSAGTPGLVDIDTFGLQFIPQNFNLTSITPSEFVAPGGVFNVGNASVNGTAGSVVSTGSANSLNAGRVTVGNQFSSGGVSITATGNSFDVLIDGNSETFTTDNGVGTPRNKVTPSIALALFQVTHDAAAGAQTVGLTTLPLKPLNTSIVTDTNPQTSLSPSLLTVPSLEIYRPFTAFNMVTSTGNNLFTLNVVSDNRVTFNLTQASLINIGGDIDTDAPDFALFNFGGKAPLVSATGMVQGDMLTFLATNSTWTINGIVQANQMNFTNPSGGIALKMASSGQLLGLNPSGLLEVSVGKGSFTLTNTTPAIPTPPLINDLALEIAAPSIQIGTLLAPVQFGAGASLLLLEATGAVSIVSKGDLEVAFNGQIYGLGGVSITTLDGGNFTTGTLAIISNLSAQNTLDLNFNAVSKGTINIFSTGDLTLGSMTMLMGGAGISLKGTNDLTLDQGTNIFQSNGPGTVNITAEDGNVNVGNEVAINAGFLITPHGTAPLLSGEIKYKGSILITAGTNINLGNASGNVTFIGSVGGDLRLLALNGDIVSDNTVSGGVFRADGGNILFAASDDIINLADQTGIFVARSVGTASSFVGGGMSFTAGDTNMAAQVTALALALKTRPATFTVDPANLGTQIGATINNLSSRGVVSGTGTIANIHLDAQGNTSELTMLGGVVKFAAPTAGAVIQLDNLQITATAPPGQTVKYEPGDDCGSELIVDTGNDCDEDGEANGGIALGP